MRLEEIKRIYSKGEKQFFCSNHWTLKILRRSMLIIMMITLITLMLSGKQWN